MAVQFTDFSRAPLIDSPFKNLVENVFKGYQLGQMPAKLAEEQKQRQLGNQLKQLEVEHKPKEFELNDKQKELANAIQELALKHKPTEYSLSDQVKRAQINKLNRIGTSGNLKPNAAVANAEYIWQMEHPGGTPQALEKDHLAYLKNAFETGQKHVETLTKRSEDITTGSAYDKLPVNDKKQVIALFKGMGVDPVEATSLSRKGVTPTEYAKANDIDISKVVPNYALGEQNIKDLQRTSSYFDEMDSLEKNITKGLGQYQNKIAGYSLEQIADQLSGENPDKVGKALAARALLPELSSLRLKIQGGNIGIEAIRELEAKSLGQLNVVESLVDTKTFNAMQKYINQWLHEAARSRLKALEKYGQLDQKKSSDSGMGSDPLGLR